MAQHILPPGVTELRDDLDQATTPDAPDSGQLSLGELRSELNGARLQYPHWQCHNSGPRLEFPAPTVDHYSVR